MTWASNTRTTSSPVSSRRLVYWQTLTVALMVMGYAGYYLCRSNFSVALPLIIQELAARGIRPDLARIRLGTVASWGVLAYAIGKFFSGGSIDFLGGRRGFLAGMVGSVCFTVLFALGGGMPLFTFAWIGNRLIQSMGWPGLVKITSRWFSFSTYGTVMGLASLSYLFGDAISRQFLATLIGHGIGWRNIFLIAAGVLSMIFVLNLLLLRETPKDIGEREPQSAPLSLFGREGDRPVPPSLRELLAPFLRSKVFWLVCVLSAGVTLVRETFNLWTPTYFTQVVGLSVSDAAQKSALFPLAGGLSVIVSGFLSDRLGIAARAAIIFGGLLLTGFALMALGYGNFAAASLLPVWITTAVAFLVIGPYSYLAGAIALDFGGKQGGATASGIIDGVGYLGGVLAGDSMARISVAYGWTGAFVALACMVWILSIAAAIYLVHQRRAQREAAEQTV